MKHWIALEVEQKHFKDIEHFIDGIKGAKVLGRMIGSKILIKSLDGNNTGTRKNTGTVRKVK